ncbi:putative adipose-regulatory protein-domain-containing protein [Desarmillaria tabescens]|uniref:Adipose-regulatory protein-domain-containing protein n=1 Tax=Armillaria tabescens TaxID=1929756 RepID=A0AA39NG21_ARMTA|nr:putative adipose-regulatory protein-domain-containing protein [Desarmillaria tabescens]KAK0464971.1 putative adipose-regulatory protein-domain-containing protein [Desarmillaria tabescens]
MDTTSKHRKKSRETRGLSQSSLASASIQYLLSLLSKFLKPFAPKIIPLVVFIFLIPLSLCLSGFAGWIVWKNVAVSWEYPLFLQYGDGLAPYAESSLPQLVSQQPYDILLHLVVPATESNLALGNFMASLRLSSDSNQTLAVVRRPAIVLPSRPSFFSGKPSTFNIDIPLLHSYTFGTSNANAHIQLGRQDGWKTLGSGEGRELSVSDAYLRGILVHRGIRGLVTRFPLISAAISSMIFLVILLAMISLCILPTMLSEPVGKRYIDDVGSEPFDDEKPPRRPSPKRETSSRRRTSGKARSRRSSSGRSVKGERSDQPIPSGSGESSSHLRRRRSRLSEGLSDSE